MVLGPQRFPMPRTQTESYRQCAARGHAQGDGRVHEGRAQNITRWYGCTAGIHPSKAIEQTIVVYSTARAIQTDAARRRPTAAVSTATPTATWQTMGPTTTAATTAAATATAVGTEQPTTTVGATAPTGQQQLAATVAQMTVRGNAEE